jgi:hypothetical protein
MKRILFLISLFVSVCFAVVSITLSKRNASISLQTENVEALTNLIVLKTCYFSVMPVSGTGVYFYQCNSSTSSNILYPCGTKIESSQSPTSYTIRCYFVPNG